MAPMICDSFFQSSAAATKRRCGNVVDRTAAEDVPTRIIFRKTAYSKTEDGDGEKRGLIRLEITRIEWLRVNRASQGNESVASRSLGCRRLLFVVVVKVWRARGTAQNDRTALKCLGSGWFVGVLSVQDAGSTDVAGEHDGKGSAVGCPTLSEVHAQTLWTFNQAGTSRPGLIALWHTRRMQSRSLLCVKSAGRGGDRKPPIRCRQPREHQRMQVDASTGKLNEGVW
ncbi:hypothetical protein B0T13DRAFT_502612 [Neurospora crassa]|nr:hypothetical protein B0T13DRAFT_502612 [Neurospora crassa]